MTSTILPFYRPRPPALNFTSQALNPMQRRRYSAFRNQTRDRLRGALSARVARGRTRLISRNRFTQRNGLLGGTNADVRRVYRKKRMPAKKRKRWARFIKKVNAVDERELGTRTVLFNDTIVTRYTNPVQQGCLTVGLYTFKNASRGWLDDLNQIGQLENEGNPTAAAGATIDKNSKIMFHSSVMDMTIRNTSELQTAAGIYALDAQAAIELDVYDIILGENTQDSVDTYTSLSELLNGNDDKEIGGTGTGIEIQDRGATPFELPSNIGRFKLKVLQKTKYFVPNGQTITLQERNPKRKVIRYGELETNDGFNKRGWTRFKFLIYKAVPGVTVGTAVGTFRMSITVGLTRKYMYKVEGFNEPRERLLGSSYTPGNPT